MLALLAVLQACSAVKLSYNNAPELLVWWLDGYVDFDDAQTIRLRSELATFQQWHRQSELPRYADSLQRIAQSVPGSLTGAAACEIAAEVRSNIDRVVAQAEPGAAALALTLEPAQLQQIQRKFAKGNAEFRSKWLEGAPADIAARRLEQSQERLERAYGSLSEAQKELLRQQLAASMLSAPTAYAERLRRQQDVLETLQKIATDKPPLPAVRESLRGIAQRTLHTGNAAYRSYSNALQREGCANFAAFHNSTTPAQRETAVLRLRGYEKDLRELASKP